MQDSTELLSDPDTTTRPLASDVALRLLGVVVAAVALNIMWLVLSQMDSLQEFWPSHRTAWSDFKLLVTDGFQGVTLAAHVGATVGRVAFALFVGGAIGGCIGAAVGSTRLSRNLADPFISFMRLVTPAAVLTIAILARGLGEMPTLIATTLPIVWIIADAMSRGVVDVGFGRDLIRIHVVPAARTALLVAWIAVSFAETISSSTGIGAAVWAARTFFRGGIVVSMLVVSTLLFLVVDYLIRLLGRLASGE